MVGRIIASDTADSGLGQWSYVKIAGRDQKQITIVTTYRPCKQSNPGDSTINAQQYCLLQKKGIKNPTPCMAWLKDILPYILQWKTEGEVILLVGVNSAGLTQLDIPEWDKFKFLLVMGVASIFCHMLIGLQ
eukprot:13844837-Ditylum_brightwellii.AAC.1